MRFGVPKRQADDPRQRMRFCLWAVSSQVYVGMGAKGKLKRGRAESEASRMQKGRLSVSCWRDVSPINVKNGQLGRKHFANFDHAGNMVKVVIDSLSGKTQYPLTDKLRST